MLQTQKHTSNFIMHLRFSLSIRALRREHANTYEAICDYEKARSKERNTITINTKNTRPVFVERENPDTPPTITDHVRELAKLIRNTNPLTERTSEFDRGCERFDMLADAFMLRYYTSLEQLHTRPLWTIIASPKCEKRRKWYTTTCNIQREDKPAYRHDSLFLFDSLSEDYNS